MGTLRSFRRHLMALTLDVALDEHRIQIAQPASFATEFEDGQHPVAGSIRPLGGGIHARCEKAKDVRNEQRR